jgi:hypothetical protein
MWGTQGGNRTVLLGILSASLALTAGGCGGTDNNAATPPAATITVTVTAPSAEPSSSPTSSESTGPADPSPVGEPTDTETPTTLSTDVADRPLTLSNVFEYPDAWKDGRYDVADRKQVPGIGGVLDSCGDYSPAVLELRLANNFSRFKLDFGQSNSSESSDQTMMVRIDTNGQYRDQKSAKLNQITSFDLPVPKVNALKITLYKKDSTTCGAGTVEAVLMNMVLS